MKKLGIFDVDGTIVAGGSIPASTVSAIKKFREKGNLAIFFTGRPITHIDKQVIDISFDGCICNMGAYIRIGDKVLQDVKPNLSDAKAVVSVIKKYKVDATFESDKGIAFCFNGEIPGFLLGIKKHFKEIGLDTEMDVEAEDFTFDKVCLWKKAGDKLEAVEDELDKYLDCLSRNDKMEEWTVKNVFPDESVGEVKKYFKIDTENCYAVGDSIGDWAFLSAAGHTAAMGQGHPALKGLVEFITAEFDNDGFARALEHFQLI